MPARARGDIAKRGMGFIYRGATDATQLSSAYDQFELSGATATPTMYLPAVGEMTGRTITIICTSVATGNVTVKPFQQSDVTPGAKPDSVIYDGSGTATSMVFTAAEAWAVLYSTGKNWLALQMDLDAS